MYAYINIQTLSTPHLCVVEPTPNCSTLKNIIIEPLSTIVTFAKSFLIIFFSSFILISVKFQFLFQVFIESVSNYVPLCHFNVHKVLQRSLSLKSSIIGATFFHPSSEHRRLDRSNKSQIFQSFYTTEWHIRMLNTLIPPIFYHL